MTGVEVALVDWEEGQYRVADKPRPRGEVRETLPTCELYAQYRLFEKKVRKYVFFRFFIKKYSFLFFLLEEGWQSRKCKKKP